MITPFPPSPTPEVHPHWPLRSKPVAYWYYPFPLGHEPEQDRREAEGKYHILAGELAYVLRPGGVMSVLQALQVLDDMIYPLAILCPFEAMIHWLAHVQQVISAIKCYAFRVPLTPEEKNLIVNFAVYWSQKRGGPCDMGRPETQIVLHTLMELAQTWADEIMPTVELVPKTEPCGDVEMGAMGMAKVEPPVGVVGRMAMALAMA